MLGMLGSEVIGGPPTLRGDGVCRPRREDGNETLGPLAEFMGELIRGAGGVGGPPE